MNVLTSRKRRLVGTLTVTLLALTAACSIRLDAPPEPVPTPDAAEQIRQAAAISTAELAALARTVTTEDDDVAAMLEKVAADADVQLEALGGVWEPPPRPADTASGATADTPDGAESSTAEDVLAALATSTQTAREAVTSADVGADLAALLGAIVLNRDSTAGQLAERIGVDDPIPAPEPQTPATLSASAAGLCRTLDALGYAGELRAARSSGDAQDRAARSAARMRDLAEQVAIAAGLDDTDADPREASYDVGTGEGADLDGQISTWRGDLAIGWLAQIAPAEPADRGGVLEHARSAALTAPGVAEDPLPGWSS